MEEKRERLEVLPAGWVKELLERADLERSFDQLSACRHFYADAMRGRIRSLQMKAVEAQEFFDLAYTGALEAPQTAANLIRQVTLHAYAFENALLSRNRDLKEPTSFPIPELPPDLVAEHVEVKYVFEMRRVVEALYQLDRGNAEEAARLYTILVEQNRVKRPSTLPTYYLGLAAAQHNLGHPEIALRSLESAGLSLQFGGDLLNQARAAGILCGLYAYLGRSTEAESWRDYLSRLPCPEATRDVFLKRGELLGERCTSAQQIVLF